MSQVKFFTGEQVPLEMHKVRMVQKLTLMPVEERKTAIEEAGFNTFLLKNRHVFMDMLTDSGVNAMSDNQYAAMMQADDSYAGSETFYRLESALYEMFGKTHFLPAHQGRACENIIARTMVTPGSTALMNIHFTTTKAHVTQNGGAVEELLCDEGFRVGSDCPFKGDMDVAKLHEAIQRLGAEKISFLRIEAGSNLIGGQPVSLKNMREVSAICKKSDVVTVFDASLLADNLYFIKTREPDCENRELIDITREMGTLFDVIYFSGRKLGCARGGGILTSDESLFLKMRDLVTLYEGFLTYGGMSVREMEALTVGLRETLDIHVIEQTPIFVDALCREMQRFHVPVVTPAGGMGCHVDAMSFCPHIPQSQYPAAALAGALFIAGGIRAMERGTMSEQRNPDGSEHFSQMELVRLAVPKRVFTLSQLKYTADRMAWLFSHREMIGGLRFIEEPATLRFFVGRLEAIGDWPQRLAEQFRKDFGESL